MMGLSCPELRKVDKVIVNLTKINLYQAGSNYWDSKKLTGQERQANQ